MQAVSNNNRSAYLVQSLEYIAKSNNQQEELHKAAKDQEEKASETVEENIETVIAKQAKVEALKSEQNRIAMQLKKNIRYSDKGNSKNIAEHTRDPVETEANTARGDTEIRAYNLDEHTRNPAAVEANTAAGVTEEQGVYNKNEHTRDPTVYKAIQKGYKALKTIGQEEERKITDFANVKSKIGYKALDTISKTEERKTTDDVNVKSKIGNLAEKLVEQSNQAREMDDTNMKITDKTAIGKKNIDLLV